RGWVGRGEGAPCDRPEVRREGGCALPTGQTTGSARDQRARLHISLNQRAPACRFLAALGMTGQFRCPPHPPRPPRSMIVLRALRGDIKRFSRNPMNPVTANYIGGPTALIEVNGLRLLT